MSGFWSGVAHRLTRLVKPSQPAPSRPAPPQRGTVGTPRPKARPHSAPTKVPAGRHLEYAPEPDGRADPGEIVWTWVAYEDLPEQGKDRPVLVVGREGQELLGLMLSSNSDRDGQHDWYALGQGDWDSAHRPSWLRLDRVLRVPEAGIRREGAVLDRSRFDKVAKTLRANYGWH